VINGGLKAADGIQRALPAVAGWVGLVGLGDDIAKVVFVLQGSQRLEE
jgi:hypothetical protein